MVNTIVDQIQLEISRLADSVRFSEVFDDSTTVNVHALVCLMRYGAWKDSKVFENWIMSKPMERNPNVLDRIILMKDVDSNDGVEFRVHIFRDGNETFIHSHKQDFVTSCIKGAYIHKIWEIESDPTQQIRVQVREPGTGILSNFDTTDDRTLLGHRIESDEDGTYIQGRFKDPEPMTFAVGQNPMFVNRNWHHTVEQEDTDTSVITIVARRGNREKQTTVLTDPSGGARAPSVDKIDKEPSPEVKSQMFQELLNALIHRGYSNESFEPKESSDIEKYMTKIEQMIRFNDRVKKNPYSMKCIEKFLVSNQFTTAPLVDGDGQCVGILRRPVSIEKQGGGLVPIEPQSIRLSEHLFGAVLFTVVSRDLVVPIENNDGKMVGIFSISDLVQNKDFSQALIYHFAKDKERKEELEIALNFLEKLKCVNTAFERNKTRFQIDNLVHALLLELGPLIVMNRDYDYGRIVDYNSADDADWIEKCTQWPMYKFEVSSFDSNDEISQARELLNLLKTESKIDQILIQSKHGDAKIMANDSKDLVDFQTLSLDGAFDDFISILSSSSLPIIVKKEDTYGLITPHELQHPDAISEIGRYMDENSMNDDLRSCLERHIIDSASGTTSLTFDQINHILSN
jgi:hypothetical protein